MSAGYKTGDQSGPYFVTFRIVGWADIFAREICRKIVADAFNFCIADRDV